ncbi:MAG: transposase [Acidimicrobiales bacterium]
MTIDVDSTSCEVHGRKKQGAAYGYTKVLGYHPLLATRAETGEVLHVRFRKGSAGSGRGAQRFVRELVGRVRRCGAIGPLTLRADSGFYSAKVMKAFRDHSVAYSITAPQNPSVRAAIDGIDEATWAPIEYTQNGEAWGAGVGYQGHRLIVRWTKLANPHLLPRPLALVARVENDRPGRRKDDPPTSARSSRAAHPFRPTAPDAPANKLAVGRAVARGLRDALRASHLSNRPRDRLRHAPADSSTNLTGDDLVKHARSPVGGLSSNLLRGNSWLRAADS